jgi:hypothetical protein
MQNTLRTTRITAPTRFALLALGAISLSSLALPARAGDDAQYGRPFRMYNKKSLDV